MPNNALYIGLAIEYQRAKLTLVEHASHADTRKAVGKLLHTCLALTTKKQSHLCAKFLSRSFRAGFDFEAESMKATVSKARKVTSAAAAPATTSLAFDFSKVSKTHLNKVTRDTIGDIGRFNKEISKSLLTKYDALVANNALVNSIAERGFTKHTESQLLKQGLSKELVGVLKSQSTTNKMISILEQQGIKGGMHPYQISKLLVPEIRAMFGPDGVIIDNVGKMRKVLHVNAAGEYWWETVKITRPFHTTTKNYADMVASTSMKRAHNEGRLATMRQSGLVEKFRFISQQTGNTCLTCLGLHGMIVGLDVCPPIHVKCYCTLAPVYKDPDLNLHGDDYYMKQRDAGLYREFQFRKYNKKLPVKERIPHANFLPADELRRMPSGKRMEAIRAALLE